MTDHERPSDATDDGPEIRKTGRQSPMDLGEARGGAMTGETGSLTGMDTDEAFIPGELREINDPMHSGSLTEQSADASDAHREEVRDEHRAAAEDLEGAETPIAGAGQRAREEASGTGNLQGQGMPLGGSSGAGARPTGGEGPTELATREGGYGISHGLAPDDPAYRVDEDAAAESDKGRNAPD